MSAKFEIYMDKIGDYRFRLVAANGETILVSESYTAKAGCANGVLSVKTNAINDGRYERKETVSGNFMFNLKSSNGQVIGTSEVYETSIARDKGIDSVKKSALNAHTVVLA